MFKKTAIILLLSLYIFPAAADDVSDTLNGFIARLKELGSIPNDEDWESRLRSTLETRLRQGAVHPSAFAVAAESFPAHTLEDDPAGAGRLALRLLEFSNEALRRGEPPAVVRSRIRRETGFMMAGVSAPDKAKMKRVKDLIDSRGRDNRPGLFPPGSAAGPGGPTDIVPGVPQNPGGEDNQQPDPGEPGR